MPFIKKRLLAEEVNVGDKKTLILDAARTDEVTRELDLQGELGRGLSYKEIIELRKIFGNLSLFKYYLKDDMDIKWLSINTQIENIEEFYNIIWERTIIELMFVSQYYLLLISNPSSFEQVLKGGTEFEYWFKNVVQYTMLEKIKNFYCEIVEIYASNISLDIYESDVELKAKEVINEIENAHLLQVKELLNDAWEKQMATFNEWEKTQELKRKTIIFD